VAAGGDGTLNELVGAMVKYGAPPTVSAALVPFGTANDFAAATGISQVRQPTRRALPAQRHCSCCAPRRLGAASPARCMCPAQDPREALAVAVEADNIHPIDVGLVNGQVCRGGLSGHPTAGLPPLVPCPARLLHC
jgi:diacylglycerol kinase family enzyme